MTTIPSLPFSGQQLRDTLAALDGAIDGKEASGTAAAAVAAHVAAADPHPNYTTTAEAAAAAPVQSVALSVPVGWSGSTTNTGGSVTLTLALPGGSSLVGSSDRISWNTAFTERNQWDGGSTGLNAATGRISLGLGNVNNTADADKPISTATATALAGKADSSDARLSDAREWSATTISQSEAEAGTATTRRAFTAQRVFQSVAAWWGASAAKTKLDGIAGGATANSPDATLLARANHTGTQLASTISDLGGAALLSVGTTAGTVAAGNDPRFAGGSPTFTGYAVGNWLVPFSGSLATSAAVTANNIVLIPFYVERIITTDELAARINTAATGASFAVAIYGTSNGQPAGLPIASTGSLSAAAAATVSGTVSPVTLQPGVAYWAASNTDGSPVYATLSAAALHSAVIVGAPTAGEALSSGNNTFFGRVIAHTFGTWPDLTGVTTTVLSTVSRRGAIISVRISALP